MFQPVVPCKQTSNRLSKRLFNPLYNRLNNRLFLRLSAWYRCHYHKQYMTKHTPSTHLHGHFLKCLKPSCTLAVFLVILSPIGLRCFEIKQTDDGCRRRPNQCHEETCRPKISMSLNIHDLLGCHKEVNWLVATKT